MSAVNNSQKEKKKKKSVYITTPIFYPNGKPHIGSMHTMILADFLNLAFKKVLKYKTYLLTGLDEHGDKVYNAAKKSNQPIKKYLKEISIIFKDLAKKIDMKYNCFIRTTEKKHTESVLVFWNNLEKNNMIYRGEYVGYYAIRDETMYTENELIDKKAPTGAEVEEVKYNCCFLKSSKLEQNLKTFYEKHPNFVYPTNRINELKGFISEGLKDLCISRPNCKWGIKAPGTNDIIYVWIDALINYITACNYPNLNETWTNSEIIHVVGKDIVNFHGVHWPVLLSANNINYDNMRLFVHNWWLVSGEKMSKSLGNIIEPFELLEKFGTSAVRFYILKNNLVSNDFSFSSDGLIDEYNTFLVGKFSNLIHRIFSLTRKNNLIITKKMKNIKYEKTLKSSIKSLDISAYIKILFEWCDELNTKVNDQQVWKDQEKTIIIAQEILSLIQYFVPIVPSLAAFNPNDGKILFNRINKDFI